MLNLEKWHIHVWKGSGHPIEKETAVDIIAYIRNNSTGEVREHKDYLLIDPEDNDTPSVYIWSEGNYSCDCNRDLFFYRSNGDEPNECIECGDEAYSVNLQNSKTGEIFYREFK